MIGQTIQPLIERENTLSSEESSVLKILLYFDIFRHPLRLEEISSYSSFGKRGILKVQTILNDLKSKGLLYEFEGYYMTQNNEQSVKRRLNGEKYALSSIVKAKRYSALIARFPFVRGICLSGSISKLYMDKEADIDYFIITSPERLWIARTFLVLFKKIFLLNSKKYFCVNYFVTEESLSIPNKNIFTATELAFLIPTYDYHSYNKLMLSNEWYRNYYPQFDLRDKSHIIPESKYFFKPYLERLFSGKLGEKLDCFFFKKTLNHWKNKFQHFDPETFDLRLRSKKNESKHHPLGYQERILHQFENNILNFEKKHAVKLDS